MSNKFFLPLMVLGLVMLGVQISFLSQIATSVARLNNQVREVRDAVERVHGYLEDIEYEVLGMQDAVKNLR